MSHETNVLVPQNGAQTLTLSDVTIDGSAGDSAGGKNTDCFDIGKLWQPAMSTLGQLLILLFSLPGSSDGVTITGATCKNQDDCVAINSGTNIKFTGGTCSGGHGLSIGSVGGRDDNTVKTVEFSSSTVSNSMNGVRIKAKSGETGTISGIT